MTDMNLDWARDLLHEAAGIYLAHVLPDEDAEALARVFVAGGHEAVHRHLNADERGEMAAEWPDLPDLDGRDMFGHLPVVGE